MFDLNESTSPPHDAHTPFSRRTVLLAALLFTLLGAFVLVIGTTMRSERRVVTAFRGCACTGYVWAEQPVRSVSATWRVPVVDPRTVGIASTWIGAESDGRHGRFIQIGFSEGREVSAGLLAQGLHASANLPFYAAFWSDTAHHFQPQWIGGVEPGDLVRATLRLEHGRWALSLLDGAQLLSVHIVTRQEGGGPVQAAEWLQEDTARSVSGAEFFRYPKLSTVTFSDLRADGVAPRRVFSVRRRLRGAQVALSPLRNASFTVKQIR